MSEIADIFGALPIEAQNYCNEQWSAAFSIAQSRHVEPADAEQKAATEDLVRLFFVHGYMTAMRETRKLTDAIAATITAAREEVK